MKKRDIVRFIFLFIFSGAAIGLFFIPAFTIKVPLISYNESSRYFDFLLDVEIFKYLGDEKMSISKMSAIFAVISYITAGASILLLFSNFIALAARKSKFVKFIVTMFAVIFILSVFVLAGYTIFYCEAFKQAISSEGIHEFEVSYIIPYIYLGIAACTSFIVAITQISKKSKKDSKN